jgi:hypothetical protein
MRRGGYRIVFLDVGTRPPLVFVPDRLMFLASTRAAKIKNAQASKPAKVEIRRNVLDALGRDVAVFDAFAGAGEMYRNVWHEARACVGCDLDWHRDERVAYVADNRRVMRCIDLGAFAVFDLDAHGSPWEQATILAARRKAAPGERIGLVLTDGSGLDVKRGNLSYALAQLVGMPRHVTGAIRWHDEIITRAINEVARRMGCEVETRWQAGKGKGAAVVYVGVVLREATKK